jgi:glutathione peroxidase
MFEKIDVNGENAHPIYKFLRSKTKGFLNDDIKWNFTKFLVNDKGDVVRRYAPTTTPMKIKSDIENLLK